MAFSAVFVPALLGVMIVAKAPLLVTSRILGWVAGRVGLVPVAEGGAVPSDAREP